MSTCEAKQLILMYLFRNNMIGSTKNKRFFENKNSYYFFGCHFFFHPPGIAGRSRIHHSNHGFWLSLSFSYLHTYTTLKNKRHIEIQNNELLQIDTVSRDFDNQSNHLLLSISLSLSLYPERHTVLSKIHCSSPSENVIFSEILLRKDGDSEGEHSFDEFALFDPIPGG